MSFWALFFLHPSDNVSACRQKTFLPCLALVIATYSSARVQTRLIKSISATVIDLTRWVYSLLHTGGNCKLKCLFNLWIERTYLPVGCLLSPVGPFEGNTPWGYIAWFLKKRGICSTNPSVLVTKQKSETCVNSPLCWFEDRLACSDGCSHDSAVQFATSRLISITKLSRFISSWNLFLITLRRQTNHFPGRRHFPILSVRWRTLARKLDWFLEYGKI